MPCDTCEYFEPFKDRYLESDGECRKQPPSFDSGAGSCWPLVKTTDWCGEYTRALMLRGDITPHQSKFIEFMKGSK